MSSSDAELMIRFVEGDESSFEMLVERYEEPLLNFFYRLTRDRQASEDLAQEAFLRLLRSSRTYTVKAAFKTFLYRIARNLWIDRYRSLKIRPYHLSLDRKISKNGEGTVSMAEQISGSDPVPGAELEADEMQALLRQAIVELPQAQQEIFVIWLESGMKYADISEILDVPVGTIKSRMHSAVNRLKEKLRKHLGER